MSGPYASQFGHPAVFGPDAAVSAATSNDFVYYIGTGDAMRYLQVGADSSGTPVLTDIASTSTSFGYSSGSPVVTSNGPDPASAVVWAVASPGGTGSGASLQAFNAVPASSCTSAVPCPMNPIWSAPIGTASKFTIPATDGGRVYVGTRDGNVICFGSPDKAPLAGSPVNFGRVPVGGRTRIRTVTLTASASVTVTGMSVPGPRRGNPFRLGKPSLHGSAVTFPVALTAGATLTVPVTFGPARASGVTGVVQVTTLAANFPAISVSLTGQGTAPGLQASASALRFGTVPDMTTSGQTVLISNQSTGPERITATSAPHWPFRAGLPHKGIILAAGQTVAVPVTVRPGGVGPASSSFTISTSGRHVLTIRLTVTGTRAVSRVTAGHRLVQFGSVPVGSRATRTIVVTNAGNLPAVISGAAGLTAPFGLQASAPAGLPVNPGYHVSVPVSFSPTSAGQVTGHYLLRWRDATGRHALTVVLTGGGIQPASGHAVPPPGGGWTFNGTAAMLGEQLVLSNAVRQSAASAIYGMPTATSKLTVTFTAQLTGDGGLTIALLPATASAQALGGSNGKLGFGGLSGVAVTLAAGSLTGTPSGNFAGIAASGRGGGLRYFAASSKLPDLRQGTHQVTVSVRGRTIGVSVDGGQAVATRLPAGTIPASALIGFTGATGQSPGSQRVSSVTVNTGGSTLPVPGGGWSFNGTAAMAGAASVLTPAAKHLAGSVVYPVALPTAGLNLTFTAELHGGSGGNGMTFALLDPAHATATSVGANGGGQGFAGLGGVAVVLSTEPRFGVSNWMALWAGAAGQSTQTVLQLARAIAPLRAGPHTVTVQVTQHSGSYIVAVWLDGDQILQQIAPTLTSTSVLAFTGGTGYQTDVHLVRDIAISAAG
jgi:hypothetical protein